MKKIYSSRTNKKLAGIIGGLGETYDVDPTLLRLIVVIVAVLTGFVPVILAYFIAWLVVPKKNG